MSTLAPSIPSGISRASKSVWAGRILSGLVVAFLVFDGVAKQFDVPPVTEAMTRLGYPVSQASGLGLLLLAITLLYVIPRTAVLGAVLLTAYLGGAVATHVRVEDPWLGFTLFPVYVGLAAWGGLYLREPRLRALLPFRSDDR